MTNMLTFFVLAITKTVLCVCNSFCRESCSQGFHFYLRTCTSLRKRMCHVPVSYLLVLSKQPCELDIFITSKCTACCVLTSLLLYECCDRCKMF
ncbi:hypothetical protein M758_11G036100 [Ceratodon purpureus]|uniref:Secreted protein n=1 Tax=Ceratodon purpureus TaxID=3225 RepID=A0A8T0GAL5_CERPU|nr:hypothetical protein KC19_11G037100 [Ceratodon purpureus]KAG0600461.1 hypothetical protein M758_11G036100 [Ceratodon purpureus]